MRLARDRVAGLLCGVERVRCALQPGQDFFRQILGHVYNAGKNRSTGD
jgi:hypothetical protein